MPAEIVELGPHERMSPAEALGLTSRESPSEVVILYYDANGVFGMRTSGMKRKDVLWLLEEGRRELFESDGEET